MIEVRVWSTVENVVAVSISIHDSRTDVRVSCRSDGQGREHFVTFKANTVIDYHSDVIKVFRAQPRRTFALKCASSISTFSYKVDVD